MNHHPEFGSDIFVPDDVITLPSRDGVNDWFKIQGKWTKKSDVVTITEVLRFVSATLPTVFVDEDGDAANMLALTPTACLRGSQMSFETYRAMYCNREPWNMRTVQALKGSPWNLCWW